MSKHDRSITFSMNVDNSKAVKKLNELEQKIAEVEQEIEEKKQERNGIEEQLNNATAAAERSRQKIKLLNEEMEKSRNTAFEAWGRGDNGTQLEEAQRQKEISAEIERQNALMDEAAKRMAKFDAELVKVDRSLKNPTKKLDQMQRKAGELTEEITYSKSAMARMKSATAEADARMEKLSDRVKNLVKRVFVFSLITSALRAMKDWFGNVIKSNKEASAAIAKLKGALLTLVQPLVNVIIPAFTTLVNVLTKVVNTLSNMLSPLFGTTTEEAAKAAEALYDESEAMNATGSAAKKAGGKLASFDEINTLSSNDEDTSSSIAPDFSGTVSNELSAVAELFTGIALLALGAVLTLTGASIPTGLAMMVAGAAMVYGSFSSDGGTLVKTLVETGLYNILLVAGAAELAIGAILAFSGANIPVGIALMAHGAAVLAGGVALVWGEITGFIETHLNEMISLVSTAFLALGALFAFAGINIPLGIALMAVGAAGLVALIPLNWEVISGAIEEHLDLIIGIVAAAALALGAILALTGVNVPLGVALLLVGAAGLAAEIGLNWDSISEALEGPIGVIVAAISTAVLVLGAILAFTGANIPLGIALMAAGAIGLAEVVSVNWDTIVKALQGPVGVITGLVGAALLVLGVVLLFSGAGIPLGLGLIVAGGVGLAAAIIPNWNFLLEKIRGAWEAIKTWFKTHVSYYLSGDYWSLVGKSLINGFLETIENGLNFVLSGVGKLANGIIKVLNKIPGVEISDVDWGHLQLPRLASGAVIPPNREFLAVLGDQKSGTNIETPLATMVDAFKQALSEMGGTGGQMTVKLYLDGRELAENQVVHINNMTRENGEPVLLT